MLQSVQCSVGFLDKVMMLHLQHVYTFTELKDPIRFIFMIRKLACYRSLALLREPKIKARTIIFMDSSVDS